jgi:membrane-associated phospholipid phosphatase
VSTAEFAELGTAVEPAVEPFQTTRAQRWAFVRRIALAAYVVALLAYSVSVGIPVQRELVIGWICGGLALASIGRSPREILLLLRDWVPLAAILVVYDLSRGVADQLGTTVHYTMMVDVDRFLFFGQTPTEWLQAGLIDLDRVAWWEVGFTLVYISHFIVPFAVAGALWARAREAFLQFSRRIIVLSFFGLATYVAFPAAPPWLAAEQGLLDGVHRTTSRGWQVIDVGTASAFQKGQATVNLVAAVPSLHAAFAALASFFLWRRVRRRWRPLLAAYPVAMGFALVATGEHYAFDILLGWLYAAGVLAGCTWWERRRADRAGAVEPAGPIADRAPA